MNVGRSFALGLALMLAQPNLAYAYAYAEDADTLAEPARPASRLRPRSAAPTSHELHHGTRNHLAAGQGHDGALGASRLAQPPPINRAAKSQPIGQVRTAPAATTHPSAAPVHAASAPDDEVETLDTHDVSVQADVEGPNTWWGDAWPVWDRVFDAHTPRTQRKHKFGTLISHRNNAGFAHDAFHSLLGFDQGLLKVGLGVRFGVLDQLDIGILRMNGTVELFNTYEFDAKYQILSQLRFGIDLGARLGLTWFEQRHAKQAAGFFGQLLAGRLLFDRLYLGGGMLYHSSSSSPTKAATDSKGTVALQAYVEGRITRGLSFGMELTAPLGGYSLVNPAFTMGPRFITNRHTFAIVLSNTQYTTADGIVTGSYRTNFADWVLGFNITRELG
jgi:hypothetical protein